MADIEKLDGRTMDIVEQNIEQLKELFPSVFSEGKIQFNQLEELLGNYVVDDEDHYNFTWHGKRQSGRLAQTSSTGTLRPAKDESVDWHNTENLFIEGDNLEVLKLLQKSYHRQVKMIYIDPPYNTGNDFIYEDDFKDGVKNYLEMTGQVDGDGKKVGTNSSSAGRYHTNWLNMMYPRLKLARNLMRDDGVIFISIDDNEQDNLKKLCNEVFGEENFLANIIWQHSVQPKGYSGIYSVHHNHILSYRKTTKHTIESLERSEKDNKNYSNPDNDPKGKWRTGDVRNSGYRPNLIYPIQTPSGKIIDAPDNGWRWSKETLEQKIQSKEIIFSADETRITRKIYLTDQDGRTPETIWFSEDAGNTREGAKEIKSLFDDQMPFDTVKPTNLMQRMMQVSGLKNNDICLDFFAGSGSTAQALFQHNCNSKFILVQLPEPIDSSKPHGKIAVDLGFKTIADISKERIRRAGKKIKEESPDYKGDLGFKVFKLDSSNIKRWDADFDTLESDLMDAVDYLVKDRTDEDVLYELCLKLGLDLTIKIEEKTIAGKKLFILGRGYLVVCLDDAITMDLVNGIGALKDELAPEDGMRVVFKDDGFKDDVVKTNALQTLKRFGIDDFKSL
jgi:adenine-specific DNA-methyltransferase